MTRVYFFGVISADHQGHYLYDANGQAVWSSKSLNLLPFRYAILDGGLLPPGLVEEQGKLHLAVINGWTILGMWDRSADTRGNCNASFIVEGVHALDVMIAISKDTFPNIWTRIHGQSSVSQYVSR